MSSLRSQDVLYSRPLAENSVLTSDNTRIVSRITLCRLPQTRAAAIAIRNLFFFCRSFDRTFYRFSIQSVLRSIMFDRHLPIPPCPVHRVNLRIKDNLIEVPHDNRQCRQDSFVEVNGGCDVEPPPRE